MSFLRYIRLFQRMRLRRKLLLISVIPLSFYSFVLFRFFKSNARFGQRDKIADSREDIDMLLVRDISLAIRVIAKYSPWTNVCRHQAYQAKLLCRLYKIPYTIYVGFKKGADGAIEGHAWTMVNGQFMTGFCIAEEYMVQTIFA